MQCNLNEMRASDQSLGLLRWLEFAGQENKEEAIVQKKKKKKEL